MIYPSKYKLDVNSKHDKIIKVIGVGGAGGNAVLNLFNQGMADVDYVVCNTDLQVLDRFPEEMVKIQLGAKLTKGLGAGTDWEVGRDAAKESESTIKEVLENPTEMVFITAGMGGGTGTGAAPEIAKYARELGRLTIGIVTDPFSHEGRDKIDQALAGIEQLQKVCDTVLVIKNDRLGEMFGDFDIDEAYQKADEVLANAVKSIAELITREGKINLDFADVKKVLGDAGHAVMGSAEVAGEDRAYRAIEEALNSPLLENSDIKGAKRILLSIAYSDEKPEYKLKFKDQARITNFIETKIRSQAQIFKHGYAKDRTLNDKVRVTIVAAKFDYDGGTAYPPSYEQPAATIPEPAAEPVVVTKQKPIKPSKGDPNQGDLFGEDNRFQNQVTVFVDRGINYDELREEPTHERLGVSLYTDAEIKSVKREVVDFKKFYNELLG